MSAQKKVEPNIEGITAMMKALESHNEDLCEKYKSIKGTVLTSESTIATNLELIKELKACVSALNTNTQESSAKIEKLNIDNKALAKRLEESKQSLGEMQSRYNTMEKSLADKLCACKEENKTLVEKLQKVGRSVQPRDYILTGQDVLLDFKPVTRKINDAKYIVSVGECLSRKNVLDINKFNVLAVAYDNRLIYLCSETSKEAKRLGECECRVNCLAWNQQGTFLAIGVGDEACSTIEIWDVSKTSLFKRLEVEKKHKCRSLSWKGNIITAGAGNYKYQWEITGLGDDQDIQSNIDRSIEPSKEPYIGQIDNLQWSDCKSILVTTTKDGLMYIYDEKSKRTGTTKAHENTSNVALQCFSWNTTLFIATGCNKKCLKLWRAEDGITSVKAAKPKSGIYDIDWKPTKDIMCEVGISNIEWIPSKEAIITGHTTGDILLWTCPDLSLIKILKGHASAPWCLALNADKSAMVSKAKNEMIFWKPFDEFQTPSNNLGIWTK
eukprot:CAMPEP_0175048758 /NCGR_PEP_ID=MMETSP0052_2-20121109/6373_1 /TAXON_ID=51329 ORGANISM="Polytomella parva, Strain SAG 63-3" /NCGR_SAMPLE_ID=MMETSP0052_2 /ASSEMBLY_ACC=CAM_ASM_000194 /LENGTH=496 /DNA_ID=CAMNT_0016312869 /DNA_START=329 /DNA_END=1819 /DNA_ORIENTATION=-